MPRARLLRSLAATLALALALLGSAAAQEAARPAGRIVIPRDADLYAVLAASGAEQLLLTIPDQGLILDAALSPDGRQVVYARIAAAGSGDLGSALYVAPAGGGA